MAISLGIIAKQRDSGPGVKPSRSGKPVRKIRCVFKKIQLGGQLVDGKHFEPEVEHVFRHARETPCLQEGFATGKAVHIAIG